MLRLTASPRLLVFALLIAALTGCGGGITLDAEAVATSVAGTLTAVAPPSTPQATATLEMPGAIPSAEAATTMPETPATVPSDAVSPTPGQPGTVSSTPTATASLSGMAGATTRLPFPVSTFGEAEFDLQPGQSRSYVVNAAEGQVLMAYVTSAYSDGYLTIRGADNTEVLAGTYKYSTFWGYLPSTQDYTITVVAGASGGTYYLGVTLPIRLYSLSVSGAAEEGYSVSYIIGVPANQTMTVNLNVPMGSAALEIWGFNDGQDYVRRYDNWTTFHITTPISQDFLIEVYPNTGGIVDFTLIIEIQ